MLGLFKATCFLLLALSLPNIDTQADLSFMKYCTSSQEKVITRLCSPFLILQRQQGPE